MHISFRINSLFNCCLLLFSFLFEAPNIFIKKQKCKIFGKMFVYLLYSWWNSSSTKYPSLTLMELWHHRMPYTQTPISFHHSISMLNSYSLIKYSVQYVIVIEFGILYSHPTPMFVCVCDWVKNIFAASHSFVCMCNWSISLRNRIVFECYNWIFMLAL